MKVNALASAVDCLREIAALSRRQASELAKNWLVAHGYARMADGYIPGKGFESPQLLYTTRDYPCGCSANGSGDAVGQATAHASWQMWR